MGNTHTKELKKLYETIFIKFMTLYIKTLVSLIKHCWLRLMKTRLLKNFLKNQKVILNFIFLQILIEYLIV